MTLSRILLPPALLALVFFAVPVSAQHWEVGGAAAYGFYRDATVFSRAGTAAIGIRDRYGLSAVLTENRFKRVSGEIRYLYHDGDPFLQAGAQRVVVEGQSHTIHYDALVHIPWQWKGLQTFAALGGGAKVYRVSGPVDPRAPLQAFAAFRPGMDTQPVLSVGAGLRYPIREGIYLRVDFRDYVTPFPGGMATPATGGNIRGIMHQFTPMVGLNFGR
jgi:hypothetical protein